LIQVPFASDQESKWMEEGIAEPHLARGSLILQTVFGISASHRLNSGTSVWRGVPLRKSVSNESCERDFPRGGLNDVLPCTSGCSQVQGACLTSHHRHPLWPTRTIVSIAGKPVALRTSPRRSGEGEPPKEVPIDARTRLTSPLVSQHSEEEKHESSENWFRR
jgi:hypothetical protein